MTTTTRLLLLVAASALAACQQAPQATPATATTADAAYVVRDWPLPSTVGAAQPDLILTPDGRILLSWISSTAGRRKALQFVALGDNDHWQSAPRTIAVGNSLVANWADTPHIAATADGALWVHWLQKSAGGGYAADVVLSRSTDGGFNWSAPVPVNDDGTPTEHGFVSLWPASRDRLGVAWLDGRGKAADADAGGTQDAAAAHVDGAHADHMHGGGRMALRAATFDASLQRSGETELDAATCDCCQTDVALTARGPLLVYRDRSADEIRDIASIRFDGGTWSAPKPVHTDHWTMTACPINGPAVAADGNTAVVAWYTAADEQPRVQVARSGNAGDSFAAPVVVDRGDAVQGRVAVALGDDAAWIAWLREDASGQSLWLSRRSADLAKELQRIEIAKLAGRGKATGFPQLVVRGNRAYLVWTDIQDGAPRLRGAVVARS